MKGEKGYTILEVLIFMAVSALIFVAAVGAISGRQARVQFTQSTREFEAKLKDVINDVTTGYYPSDSTILCSVISGNVTLTTSSDIDQGTSDECLNVGKALSFNDQEIVIYSLAGKRFVDGLNPVTTVAEADPLAVSKPGTPTFNGTEERYQTLYGLRIRGVIKPSGSPVEEYGMIGILSNFGGSGIADSQTVQIGGIVGSTFGATDSQAVTVLEQLTDEGSDSATGYFDRDTDEGIIICLEVEENRRASVSVGVKGSSSTELQIDDYNEGCDDIW